MKVNPIDTVENLHLKLLVRLRSLGLYFSVALICFAYYSLGIVLPFYRLMAVCALAAGLNLLSFYRLKSGFEIGQTELFLTICCDTGLLSLYLALSGGCDNPFICLYMLPVIIAAVTLNGRYAWCSLALSVALYCGLALFATHKQVIERYNTSLIDRSGLQTHALMLGFGLCASILIIVIGHIKGHLNERNLQLAAMKLKAHETQHMAHLGLLGAGAAHELGTPLTTISVILSDWQQLGPPKKIRDRLNEIDILLTQVDRCKTIVTDLLQCVGERQAPSGSTTTLKAYFEDIVEHWSADHPKARIEVDIKLDKQPIISDGLLKQMILNLLDNGYEAGQDQDQVHVSFKARCQDDSLYLNISDMGHGFSPELLAQIGAPYVTTKPAKASAIGRGMGLYLVINGVKRLDGSFSAYNRTDMSGQVIGAMIELQLPLHSLKIQSPTDED